MHAFTQQTSRAQCKNKVLPRGREAADSALDYAGDFARGIDSHRDAIGTVVAGEHGVRCHNAHGDACSAER